MPEFSEARWWHRDGDRVVCTLCPRGCRLREGQAGFCRVRRNENDRLLSLTYGHPKGLAVDPIEKKPLFHFLPGTRVLSFGTVGCTLACRFCQNWSLSQAEISAAASHLVTPEEIVAIAQREQAPTIAYTYNEPTVFAEYLTGISRLAREQGIRNVMVSNGYIAPEARVDVFANIDGVNVDLKAFSEQFYREQTKAHLGPVLDTLAWIKQETPVWLEITTLLIPGLNDSAEMLALECDWILEHLGPDVPLHLTAFHPDYEMLDRPPTPPATLVQARDIALDKGLRFVYTGNVADPDGQSTGCPHCGEKVIVRTWHFSSAEGLDGSRCRKCGTGIPGVFGVSD